MKTFEVRFSRWKFGAVFAICLVLSALFAASALTGFGGTTVEVASTLALPLVLGLGALFLWKMFDRHPVISINEQGVRDRRLKWFGLIPWSDIQSARPTNVRSVYFSADMIALGLKDRERYWRRLPNRRRSYFESNRARGLGDATLYCSALDARRDEIFEVIREHLRLQGNEADGA